MSTRANTPHPTNNSSPSRESSSTPHPPAVAKGFLTSFLLALYAISQFGLVSLYFGRIKILSRDVKSAKDAVDNLARELDITNGAEFLDRLDDHEFDAHVDSMGGYHRFEKKWTSLVQKLTEEWKTMNIVSALLIPGLLTMFQIDSAAGDPVTRYLAFCSLILATFSLLFGCFFVIQFTRTHRVIMGMEWAWSDNPSNVDKFWNVGIVLSAPAVSLAWSIISFLACMVAFMWRSGVNPPDAFSTSRGAERGLRIFLSAIVTWEVMFLALSVYVFVFYGQKLIDVYGKKLETELGVEKNV
ncbi:hypothetical protein P691DRAFT_700896 [Macrolepiota fuliginosa MF-IS2]|uniref:Uncharacterized protein n=1 Tax=Macrolepiota fuliginosa MF-IS2 TaxID=1400762 RepID=A0A9P6C6R6_9AGAR|nr:hypothetical protein P691DRAFT_700896 [Macrolepiota fuliginosa MF-IS2]